MASYQQPPAPKGVQVRGRPTVGSYRLHVILPQAVLRELLNVENETAIYRTRVAANVLCEWANKQQASRGQQR